MSYSDPVIRAYIDLIKASTGAIVAYYEGDPLRIPVSNLPCAIVSKRQTRAGPLTNAEDGHEIGMSITVVTDVRADLSTDENIAQLAAGVSALYDIMEGREEDYTLKDTSLLAILRHNIALNPTLNLRTDLGSLTTIDYGTTLRDRAPEQWTIEARLDFTCTFSQVR
jgi:hypothetical protein